MRSASRWPHHCADAKVGRSSPTWQPCQANPYDGHTLATVLPAIEQQIGMSLTRIITDKGYRGHGPTGRCRSVYISGQMRGVPALIHRELRRGAAVEPVIGLVKAEQSDGTQLNCQDRRRFR
jgi:hypothetical protein